MAVSSFVGCACGVGVGQVAEWAKDADFLFVEDMNCEYKARTGGGGA